MIDIVDLMYSTSPLSFVTGSRTVFQDVLELLTWFTAYLYWREARNGNRD
jgi:hypothetical protein